MDKIAIPRLKNTIAVTDANHLGSKARVSRACEPCRNQKTKCSGETPMCRHCQILKLSCYYADRKRDRAKRDFASLVYKVATYEALLKDLIHKVGQEDVELVSAMLERGNSQHTEDTEIHRPKSTASKQLSLTLPGSEVRTSASIRSLGLFSAAQEDFTRTEIRSTGFMAEPSVLTWMKRVQEENIFESPISTDTSPQLVTTKKRSEKRRRPKSSSQLPPAQRPIASVRNFNYFLDDLPISKDEAVDAYELPVQQIADQLFEAYATSIHPSFPIIDMQLLSLQFKKFINGEAQNPPDHWLAIVNMVFAISSNYSRLTQSRLQNSCEDHLTYFARARILRMNWESIMEHIDLQQIQVAGLMSIYMLCTSQLNRAWMMAGLAIRGGVTLGMYMQNEDSSLPNSHKEARYRVWWSLYILEHHLCGLTGRMNSIDDDQITTPLPLPYEFNAEEFADLSETGSGTENLKISARLRQPSGQQFSIPYAQNLAPNPSLYFLCLVQLSRLTRMALYRLYTPAAVAEVWKYHRKIKDLQYQAENWFEGLPMPFNFKNKQQETRYFKERLNLGFLYYGTCIIINRPALCPVDPEISSQLKMSPTSNTNAAVLCLEAAMDMIGLLPNTPDPVMLNGIGPFWNVLHWLVRACAVLMLELSLRACHAPKDAGKTLRTAKKTVRWIHAMGEESESARRAWLLCDTFLRDAAKKIGREITDLPKEPPHPKQANPPQQAYAGGPGMQIHKYDAITCFDPLSPPEQYFSEILNMDDIISAESDSISHFIQHFDMVQA